GNVPSCGDARVMASPEEARLLGRSRASRGVTFLVALLIAGPALAEAPNDIDRRKLEQGLAELQTGLSGLPETTKVTVDAAICLKAIGWMLRHNEWVRKTAVRDAQNIVKIGNERIRRVQEGQEAVPLKPGKHVLAYQSFVDGSLQPYAL